MAITKRGTTATFKVAGDDCGDSCSGTIDFSKVDMRSKKLPRRLTATIAKIEDAEGHWPGTTIPYVTFTLSELHPSGGPKKAAKKK